MRAFLAARAIPGVEAVPATCYVRTIELDGARGTITVEPGSDDVLIATIWFPRPEALPAIVARIRRLFDLGADPAVIDAHLATDPALAPLVAAGPGLRVPGAWDVFELALGAIIGQQIRVRAATRLLGKLVAAHGAPFLPDWPGSAGLSRLFPRPEAMAGADIAALGMPRARGKALSSLAAAVAADPHIFDGHRDLDGAVRRLRSLPGVGEWTAQYIAMRELREPDAFPAADAGLMRAMANAGGRRPTAPRLHARAERWRPWRAYAALHLWTAGTAARAGFTNGEDGSEHQEGG
jgi:AraC family transcriptional regulator of adaptative response / DNA-3-methyladenine glycosylase II